MFNHLNRIRKSVDYRAATISGLTAGTVYIATMEVVDPLISDKNLNDLVLLGWPLVKDKNHAKLAGVAPHLVNSVAIALLYSAVGARRLPGPGWLRGLAFISIETVGLYPTAVLENHHPAIQNGTLDRFWNWKAFWLSVPRHVAFGLTLGYVYDRLAKGRQHVRDSNP